MSDSQFGLFPKKPDEKQTDEESLNPSSPDRIKHFGDPTSDAQKQWREFSAGVIGSLAEQLESGALKPSFSYYSIVLAVVGQFLAEAKSYASGRTEIPYDQILAGTEIGRAYAFLAAKRHEIAQTLKYGGETHQGHYGTYRPYHNIYYGSEYSGGRSSPVPSGEAISRKGETIWEKQKDKIWESAIALIEKYTESSESLGYTVVEPVETEERDAKGDQVILWPIMEHERLKTLMERLQSSDAKVRPQKLGVMRIIIPFQTQKPDPEDNFHIDLCYDSKGFRSVGIRYPMLDAHLITDAFGLADTYFQACREWKLEDGVDNFLKNAGGLAHILGPLLPVTLGNAAITEWMIRGLAKAKNIELGPFNQTLGIGWDFKAFLTPNRDEYAAWYAKNAFVNPQYQQPPQPQPKESLPKPRM